jgi:hypothetical protein
MKIYYFKPYSLDGNLGQAYNDYMNLLPNDEDYAVLMDGDTMMLTPNYGEQISFIVNKYKDCRVGIFTSYTNRTGNLFQCYNSIISEDGELRNHRNISIQLQREKYDSVLDLNDLISGHLMVVQKKVWKDVGFFADEISEKMRSRGIKKNLLAVDNRFSKRCLNNDYKIYLMQGIYCTHYYRLLEGIQSKDHLK